MQTVIQQIENNLSSIRKMQNATRKINAHLFCALFFLSVGDEQNFYLHEQKINSANKFLLAEKNKVKRILN
jgi:hypothetical protein